jgi:hypothetical protein
MLFPVKPHRRLAWLLMLILVAAGGGPSVQPAEPALNLQQVHPREAFERLGARHGVSFELPSGQDWVGPDTGVAVTADLRGKTFWESVLILGEQTGYEPVFEPYGRTDEGKVIVWLRRVDVRGEEKPLHAVAAGPLLVRCDQALVTVNLRMSQIRMIPMQAAVQAQVFLEPGVPATYVTAAALRAVDEEAKEFRRGEGHDPTVSMERGVALMPLHLDVIHRVPESVGRWQALMRIVDAKATARLDAPVQVVPEKQGNADQPATQATDSDPSRVPNEVPDESAVAELGPYRLVIAPVRVGERAADEVEGGGAGEPTGAVSAQRRVATLRLTISRERLDHTTWSRLYGFLLSIPPVLSAGDENGTNPWLLTGYAVYSTPSEEDPQTAGLFRVWARYEAAPGSPDPTAMAWELPVESGETRAHVVWDQPIPIVGTEPPTTRKVTTRPAAGD